MGDLQAQFQADAQDFWAEATPQRKLQALGLLASGAAVVKMTSQPKYKALGASVENDFSPPCGLREHEPGCVEQGKPMMRAPNEPITQEERRREDEPP